MAGMEQKRGGAGGETSATVLEDVDQQIYDWGIENRLDQYYGQQEGATGGGGPSSHPSPAPPPSAPPQSSPSSYSEGYILPEPIHQPQFHQFPQEQQHYARYPPPPPAAGPTPQGCPPPSAASSAGPPTRAPPSTTPSADSNAQTVLPLVTQDRPPPATRGGGRRPTLSQVDLDANELMKIERKRARNRVAASKCRLRKLERIAVLDNQVSPHNL